MTLSLCACAANTVAPEDTKGVNVSEQQSSLVASKPPPPVSLNNLQGTSEINPQGTPDINPQEALQDNVQEGAPKKNTQGNLQSKLNVNPLTITRTRMVGKLQNKQLSEISGLAAANRYPGLLYAINDSGNQPALYAISETGQLVEQWHINARNRDWEDMTRIRLANKTYLVVGDTGDNLRVHKFASLHFFTEPAVPAETNSLDPAFSIRFRYEDGPRNVEAFAAIDNSIYLLSKEPVGVSGPAPSGIYQLELPESIHQSSIEEEPLIATRIGSMPPRTGGLEARLAAALAGVDLSHPTALAFDATRNSAYVLTYREVLHVQRTAGQTWADAFAQPARRLLWHKLAQAEALTLAEGRAIWFTSEKAGAPIWAIPLEAPL